MGVHTWQSSRVDILDFTDKTFLYYFELRKQDMERMFFEFKARQDADDALGVGIRKDFKFVFLWRQSDASCKNIKSQIPK